MPLFGVAPTLEDIETLARTALERLPEPFAGHLRGVVLIVEDFPSEELLEELGIEDPFDLTGLYSGRPAELEAMTGDLPPMIHLFRRPILDEWADGGVTLEDLVVHVVVHEAGHHFGLSDDDMEWLEAELKSPVH
ncbi:MULTISPECIES: metallopeptidase family protein [Asticcacaulis]|uniref:metallopeptidase family protein n=1 Tax=Asticcacaulis TaxID=76890 RepID=UPI001AE46A0A|nr:MULTISPECIES: metallopeptidase family protein [Asticcacaulis]MBP2159618.1 putative Zn-dependent protease with MMP-like domain [Asticcacaulis solisilvae]MDR6800555.1 putative Zn-dependent protease with MMP-like domain [Asticcacaulis sp. BE141]